MKRLKVRGKTVDEAVSSALQVLGVDRDHAKVSVLSEGRSGVLGIGAEEAEIEVLALGTELEDAQQVLQDILDQMKFLTVVEGSEVEGQAVLQIKGDDMGRIIGKEGATLGALEILVRAILGRAHNKAVALSIDAGDYKEKRRKALERLANDAADEVAKGGVEKALPPMPASDRRIIHLCLEGNRGVKTHSEGQGRDRRLIISPQ